MPSNLTRRDLLKLMALLPLASMGWPRPYPRCREQTALDGDSPAPAPGGEHGRTIEAGAAEKPNILILVFDALSAANVSLYGYRRDTTPNLARFAERATVYHRHYAGGSFTTPGVGSLLTGTYPWSHRAFHHHGTVARNYEDWNLFSELSRAGYYTFGYSHNLLVKRLMHQLRLHLDLLKRTRDLCLIDDQVSDLLFFDDYNAAYSSELMLVGDGESPPCSFLFSLVDRARRFLHRKQLEAFYGDRFPRGIPNISSQFYILEHVIDWLQDELSRAPTPFFAYVHVLPPHDPYFTRRDFVDRFIDGWSPAAKKPGLFSQGHSDAFLERQRREYDEYLAYADAEFGRLADGLEKADVLHDTYVVVTSDHGELFERGICGHTTPALYEPVIRIPLLISKPGQESRQDVHLPTSAVDLLPTFVQTAGRGVPHWCEGRILPSFAGAETGSERTVFAVDAKNNAKHAPLKRFSAALIKGPHKLTHYVRRGTGEDVYELYHLADDPEELENTYTLDGSLIADLRAELQQKLREANYRYS